MADTAIEWTDVVWNPTTGCDRVSPGCDNCYALTMAARLKGMGQAKYQTDGNPRTSGPGFGLATHDDALTLPLRWTKPRRVFVNSMSDLFHDRVPDEFIARVFAVMAATPQHTYQILTKRHGRMQSLVGDGGQRLLEATTDEATFLALYDAWPLPNVWLGVSVENQQWANIRIPALLDTPAAVRWISAEPLLGAVDLRDCNGVDALEQDWIGGPGGGSGAPHPFLDWVVVGGESGPGSRPTHPEWVRSLRDQCEAADIPYFFKQWGAYSYAALKDDPTFAGGRSVTNPCGGIHAASIRERSTGAFRPGVWRPLRAGDENGLGVMVDDDTFAFRAGKKAAGRLLDGRTHDDYPVVTHA